MVEEKTLVCLRCGYGGNGLPKWLPRVEHPKKCPCCQNPNWDKPRTRRVRKMAITPEMKVTAVEVVDRIKQARERAEKLLEGLL